MPRVTSGNPPFVEDKTAVAAYVDGGLCVTLAERLNVGISARGVFGSGIRHGNPNLGAEAEADYLQLSFLAGLSW